MNRAMYEMLSIDRAASYYDLVMRYAAPYFLLICFLRSPITSSWVNQFSDANMDVTFLETIDAALQLFTLGRLDFAMSDTYFLHVNERMNSQVSENSLLDTNIHVYIHPRCSQGLESFIIVNG